MGWMQHSLNLEWLSDVGEVIIATQEKSAYIQALEIVDLLVAQERFDLILTKQDYRTMNAATRRNAAASVTGKRLASLFAGNNERVISYDTITYRSVERMPRASDEDGDDFEYKWYRFVRYPNPAKKQPDQGSPAQRESLPVAGGPRPHQDHTPPSPPWVA